MSPVSFRIYMSDEMIQLMFGHVCDVEVGQQAVDMTDEFGLAR